MRLRRLVLVLLACGCSGKTIEGGFNVTVVLEPGLVSRCARVVASGGGETAETMPMLLMNETELKVAVVQGKLPASITLKAVGFVDDGCTQATDPAEQSEAKAVMFGPKIGSVRLVLAPQAAGDGGVDFDGDGFKPPADCNDGDATVFPDAGERCGNGFDDDCDALSDCLDPKCAGVACGAGAVCSGPACKETACSDTADNDRDGPIDCADSDCAGLACGTSGMCTGGNCVAPDETGLCADGFDNDSDGALDCADPDCPSGSMCSDRDLCTSGDACRDDGGCEPSQLTACIAPNTCFQAGGMCLPDAGTCVFTLNPSGTCSDNRRCTAVDTCLTDGGCGGAVTLCPILNQQCRSTTGVCQESLDGGCFYPPAAAGSCDDGDNCTTADTCDGDGGCRGATVMCMARGECFAASGSCETDGGCLFSVRTGQPCDAGTCGADGGCGAVVVNPFPFTPSNFTPGQLPAMSGSFTLDCGVTELDSRAPDAGVRWLGLCPGQTAPAYTLVALGGQEGVLVYFDGLTISAGSELRLSGPRPVIIAVHGGATVGGTIDAASQLDAGRSGAGSNAGCGPGRGNDGMASGNPETSGGGGGGAFGTDGGDGSAGQNGGPPGSGGSFIGNRELVPLRGGCRGGNAGRSNTTWGYGGNGGGAVQLTASGQVVINSGGIVTASGAAGRGGEVNQRIAGGGAGSGGGVLIEANRIVLNAASAVTANGGAGGEGSGIGVAMWSGVDGQNGSQNTASIAISPSLGNCGGNGGNGAAGIIPAGAGGIPLICTDPNIAGGGGGGGVGRIRLNSVTGCVTAGAVVSPAATSNGTSGCP